MNVLTYATSGDDRIIDGYLDAAAVQSLAYCRAELRGGHELSLRRSIMSTACHSGVSRTEGRDACRRVFSLSVTKLFEASCRPQYRRADAA